MCWPLVGLVTRSRPFSDSKNAWKNLQTTPHHSEWIILSSRLQKNWIWEVNLMGDQVLYKNCWESESNTVFSVKPMRKIVRVVINMCRVLINHILSIASFPCFILFRPSIWMDLTPAVKFNFAIQTTIWPQVGEVVEATPKGPYS